VMTPVADCYQKSIATLLLWQNCRYPQNAQLLGKVRHRLTTARFVSSSRALNCHAALIAHSASTALRQARGRRFTFCLRQLSDSMPSAGIFEQ
jgi:hypothetical protein